MLLINMTKLRKWLPFEIWTGTYDCLALLSSVRIGMVLLYGWQSSSCQHAYVFLVHLFFIDLINPVKMFMWGILHLENSFKSTYSHLPDGENRTRITNFSTNQQRKRHMHECLHYTRVITGLEWGFKWPSPIPSDFISL